MKKYIYTLVFLTLLGVAGAFWGVKYVDKELTTLESMHIGKASLYEVKPGDKAGKVINDLFTRKVNHYILRYWLKKNKQLTQIKTGTYEIKEGFSVRDVLALLVSGKEKSYNITLVEGGTLEDFLEVIANNKDLVHKLPPNVTYDDIAKLLNSKYQYPEGLLLPDTYTFSYGDDDISLIKRANKAMEDFLTKQYIDRAKDLPYKNEYEALIMASIVEKESALAGERPIIASVFINRLNKGMRLQTDPTVIYGVRDRYKGKILKSFLADKNAYNTYQIDGLPITPIAMPSKEAIIAALNPAQTDYLFFVAEGPDSRKGHVFSKSAKEHQRAVYKYRQNVKAYKKSLLTKQDKEDKQKP